jgi:ADP-ribose pyrophosphatase YjhB (NUDIX family)
LLSIVVPAQEEVGMGCTVHKLVADVALYADGEVLLVKYDDAQKYDGEAGWFLPDDYLRRVEHPADAAARIVRGQLGIEAPPLELAEIESFAGRDGTWHLIFHYRGEVSEAMAVDCGATVADAQWFGLSDLPPAEEVAHHGWALDVIGKMLV